MRELIISLSDFLKTDAIEVKKHKYTGNIDCKSDIFVSFRAVKISNGEIYVSGRIKGFVYLECSRCLRICSHPLEISIGTNMNIKNGYVDIGEEIRQLLLLEMPMKPVCSSDCIGICKICGKHNKKNGSCLCADKDDELVKERWKALVK
ncbi:hypothetical protein AGMMS50222_03440 [Endomicrobiia bacterium]|nr:hypothetical protein AGMMS49531_02790 [Endomicrobiia bacterium]GHT64847.1 hypothetical protein AGMMS49556_03640 [Endomicrobiia bacterium]GHT74387.1 hypothetical protein AGMMS50222_03440 [Endomicrobiia bacterium]